MKRLTKRFWWVTLGVSAVVLLILFVITPWLAVNGLIQSAKAGDAAGLERRVDFPAFRDSLKTELNARMRAELREELSGEDSALASLGMILAPQVVDTAVDAFVTPEAIASMVQTAEAPGDEDATPEPASEDDGSDIRQSYGFRDPDTFVVTLTDPDRPGRSLDLLMERRNLVQWKLAGVDLPE